MNWPKMHLWCQMKFGIDGYGWRGSLFSFANEEYFLEFCDTWMFEDEYLDEELF